MLPFQPPFLNRCLYVASSLSSGCLTCNSLRSGLSLHLLFGQSAINFFSIPFSARKTCQEVEPPFSTLHRKNCRPPLGSSILN